MIRPGMPRVVAVAALASLSSCSSVTVEKLEVGGSPIVGRYPYALSRTSFTVTATVSLTSCGATQDDPKKDIYRPILGLTEVITATPVFEADPEQVYDVPYDQLRRVFGKETNVTVTRNGNGTLSGINATVNDQVGPGVVAAIQTAVKIAAGVAVPALGAAELVQTVAKTGSKGGVMNARAGRRTRMVTTVKHHTPPPTFCSAAVTAALKAIDEKTRDATAKAAADVKAKATSPSPDIAKDQADVVRLQSENRLTRTVRLTWTPTPGTGREPTLRVSRSLDIYQDVIAAWLSADGRSWFEQESAAPGSTTTRGTGPAATAAFLVTQPLIVSLELKAFTVGGPLRQATGTPAAGDLTQERPDGIVIRDPAQGVLRLCRGACSPSDQELHDVSGEIAPPVAVAVGQFGRMFVFHLKNRLFENSTFAIALAADGSISSVGNHTAGTLAAGLGTLGDAGTAAVTNTAAYNTALAARNTNALNGAALTGTLNKDLADCITNQELARKAGAVPIGTCG